MYVTYYCVIEHRGNEKKSVSLIYAYTHFLFFIPYCVLGDNPSHAVFSHKINKYSVLNSIAICHHSSRGQGNLNKSDV